MSPGTAFLVWQNWGLGCNRRSSGRLKTLTVINHRCQTQTEAGQPQLVMEILGSSPMALGSQWAWDRACQQTGEGMEGSPSLQPCHRGKDKG